MRHIYEFHGFPISEELLLGLGAGVGFVYWHMKGAPPILGGRANVGRPGEEGLERTTGRRTGVRVETVCTGSARKAEAALLELLASGEPVMIVCDMGFLPYFDLPEDFHFGGHVVVVAGYDPESRMALVADRDEQLHPVSLDCIALSRGSKFKPFPPRNQWFTFDFAEKRAPRSEEVVEAIREATTLMLNPPIANLGVKGIHTAAERIIGWPKIMEDGELRSSCFNTFVFIDATGGTGGGIFRYMYGRFLAEAAGLTGESRLAGAGDEFRAIGDSWQSVAETFKTAHAAPDPAALLPEASALIVAIADRELAAWKNLREIVGGTD